MKRCTRGALFRLCFLVLACFHQPLWAATFVVNSTADVADANRGDGFCETAAGNGVCTLRAAIQEANFTRPRNTVVVPSGFYQISAPRDPNPTFFDDTKGAFNVSGINIIGAGPGLTIIDGGGLDTVMLTGGGSSGALIANLTIQNGRRTSGLPLTFSGAGGIDNNSGVLRLRNVIIKDNFGDQGGGIVNSLGVVFIESSTIRGNTSRLNGAGIANRGRLTVRNSTISDNQVIVDASSTDISMGGGISNDIGGTMDLTNVTISGNRSGGIFSASTGANSLVNVTIVRNTPSRTNFGGALSISSVSDVNGNDISGTHTIKNSLIADNGLFNCAGLLTSHGYNLERQTNDSCGFTADATSMVGVNPLLLDLLPNGGPTSTHALAFGSPAINGGDPQGCTDSAGMIVTDQRGGVRPVGERCDIGAYEFLAPVAVAGLDRRVIAGSIVQLDGTASKANDGAVPSFLWMQIAGALVPLAGADTATPVFTAPSTPGTFTFQLALTDSVTPLASTASISVSVNAPPTANAGADTRGQFPNDVFLDGTGSVDSDGSIVSYSWVQTGGTSVTLNGARTPRPNFTPPSSAATLTFQLTVIDTDGEMSSDTVVVGIGAQLNNPPTNGGRRGGGGGGSMSFAGLLALALLVLARSSTARLGIGRRRTLIQ